MTSTSSSATSASRGGNANTLYVVAGERDPDLERGTTDRNLDPDAELRGPGGEPRPDARHRLPETR
jgi:hypothetical protein